MGLTEKQRERYSRQILLNGVGTNGQEKLLHSSVLVIGAGGLGSAILPYLAGAGVGRIGLFDSDVAEIANVHRQVLHHTGDAGRPKVESARDKMLSINPEIEVEIYQERFRRENALEVVARYDAIVDASDNFPARFLANDACFFTKRPFFFGSVIRYEGQTTVFFPGREGEPCYRCLFPEPPPPGHVPTVAEVGVLGTIPGLIGMLEATEVLKFLLGVGRNLNRRILLYDSQELAFRPVAVARNPHCALCGDEPTITSLFEYDSEGNVIG